MDRRASSLPTARDIYYMFIVSFFCYLSRRCVESIGSVCIDVLGGDTSGKTKYELRIFLRSRIVVRYFDVLYEDSHV